MTAPILFNFLQPFRFETWFWKLTQRSCSAKSNNSHTFRSEFDKKTFPKFITLGCFSSLRSWKCIEITSFEITLQYHYLDMHVSLWYIFTSKSMTSPAALNVVNKYKWFSEMVPITSSLKSEIHNRLIYHVHVRIKTNILGYKMHST